MKLLQKYSFGVGDRFGHQAAAQLAAFERLYDEHGVLVVPVWNKSNREHNFIGSEPASVQQAAAAAVAQRNWTHGWHVDADHINLTTVDRFLPHSDFFTIDVADAIGQPADDADAWLRENADLLQPLHVPGIDRPLQFTHEQLLQTVKQYLTAVRLAGEVYRHIRAAKGDENAIIEVSMDETDAPQTPEELLVILRAISREGIPIQTIAPKFTGRFNKGVDYVGNLGAFAQEFRDDLAVIKYAVGEFGLPQTLKLSVHSGSDKFSLYPIIRAALADTGAGIHIKTAGTNWLEELIGLAEAGGDALAMVNDLYAAAFDKREQLCGPYATVIDIDPAGLAAPKDVARWSSHQMTAALRHEPDNPAYNRHMRQLLHVGFKLAAQRGTAYTDLLKQHAEIVGKNVTTNLYERHMKPLFVG